MSFVYFITPMIIGYYVMEFTKVKARENVILPPASADYCPEVASRNRKLQNVLTNIERSGGGQTDGTNKVGRS